MKKSLLLSFIFAAVALPAQNLYVDFYKGKGTAPGTKASPLTFNAALKKAMPGDVIYILPSDEPIYATLFIKELAGKEDKPITIDGMNNIFTGAVPLKSSEWVKVREDLYRKDAEMEPHVKNRLHFIHNEIVIRSKNYDVKCDAESRFKSVDELQPGEWTIVDADPNTPQQHNVKHRYYCYIRLGNGEKNLREGKWMEPKLQTGVRAWGMCDAGCPDDCLREHLANIVFRNIITTHYWNDGFGIVGNARNISFENIAAVKCGDDGISSSHSSSIKVKNFISIDNTKGIFVQGRSIAEYDNVYIEKSASLDISQMHTSDFIIRNAAILSDSESGIQLRSRAALFMKDCLFFSYNPGAMIFCDSLASSGFWNVSHFGYRRAVAAPGISEELKKEAIISKISAKKAELFANFGGNLEKICVEK